MNNSIDQQARSYYEKRGFESLKGNKDSLVLDLLPILKLKS